MLLFTFPGSDAADSLMELLDSSYSDVADAIKASDDNMYLDKKSKQ